MIAVVAAYALALQALLFAVSGALPAGANPLLDHTASCAPDRSDSSGPDHGAAHSGAACCVLTVASWGAPPWSASGFARHPQPQPIAKPLREAPALDLASLIRPLGPRAPPLVDLT